MNLDRDSMLYAVSRAAGASEKRMTIPILENARIRAHGGAITVDATDLEITWLCRASGDAELACTVNARRLLDVLKAAPAGEQIKVNQTDSRLGVQFGKSKFSLATLPIEDYPETQSGEVLETIEITQTDLAEMIAHTLFAVSQEDVRHYLKGALFVAQGGGLRVVATDGHRLALNEKATLSEADFECIVPRKALLELKRALSPTDEVVRIGFGSGLVSFDLGSEVLTSRVIDGRFPDYKKVIPKPSETVMTINREALRQSINRVAIVAHEKHKAIRMVVSESVCRLMSANSSQEEAVDELTCEYSGPDIEIAFNLIYILDAVSAVDSERVRIELRNGDSAALITDDPPTLARYIVMPQRV